MKNPFWFSSDWVNPFGAYNWIDFAFIHASGEYDCRFGCLEFHVALVGLHFGARWRVADGDLEFQAEIERMVDEIQTGRVLAEGEE